MNPTRITAALATTAALAAIPAAAHAGVTGQGSYKVCASTLVEKAPGSRPIGVVFKSMTFRVTSAKSKTTHPSSGPALRWAKGVHTTSRHGRTIHTTGWVRTGDLAKSC